MIKLSIIVPVYNVQKYIKITLDSLVNQDVAQSEYEIIVINDGSPDNSAEIVKDYIKTNCNLKLYNQENSGLSVARNEGLKKSCGEYVWFVDSDDWIATPCMSKIFKYLNGIYDEVVIGAADISDDMKTILRKKNFVKTLGGEDLSGKECWLNNIPQIATAQLTIYRKDFLLSNNLFFEKGIYHEDFEFSPRASYLSTHTIYINELIYYQRQTPNSITRSINPKKSYDYLFVAKRLKSFCELHVKERRIKRKFHYYITMAINNSLYNLKDCSEMEIENYENTLKFEWRILFSFFKSGSIKYIIQALITILMGFHPVKTYLMIKKIID